MTVASAIRPDRVTHRPIVPQCTCITTKCFQPEIVVSIVRGRAEAYALSRCACGVAAK